MIIDGRIVEIGDIFYDGLRYERIFAILSKEDFFAIRSHCVDVARITIEPGFHFDVDQIGKWKFIEHWNPTEAKDKNGEVIHIGGWVCYTFIHQLHRVKVLNCALNKGDNTYYLFANSEDQVVNIRSADEVKVIPDPTIKSKIEITVTKNGEPYHGKLNIKILREKGILE